MIRVRLVPVDVFGVGCDDCCTEGEYVCSSCGRTGQHGYGLMDAVSSWSDCNRASGRIYRFDEDTMLRDPGDTLTVWVDPDEFAGFRAKRFPTE